MVQLTDGWPELTYRYLEHYYWEPQHLIRTKRSIADAKVRGKSGVEAFYRRIRSQEVPLNYLLNVFLRIAPSSIRCSCLAPFGIEPVELGRSPIILKTPCELDFIQADVYLESETARVFIEVKVNARLTLSQIKKYIQLHAELDKEHNRKHYILFLSKRDTVTLSDAKLSFNHETARPVLADALGPDGEGVTFGSATWTAFAQNILHELDNRRDETGEAAEMLDVLIGDFLSDLSTRKLISV